MTNLNLDYYYGNEAEQYSFFRIPKILSTDHRYSGLSLGAKFLYGLLLDRMGLSAQNGWMDQERRIYIYFKLDEAMRQIGCGHTKAVRLFAELEQIGLIERRKQGMGRPTQIYVKNFVLPEEPGQMPPERSCTPSAPPAPEGFHAQQTPDESISAPEPEASWDEPAPVLSSASDTPPLSLSRPDFPETEAKASQKGKSRLLKNGSQDFHFPEVLYIRKNKTEKNNTESIYPYPPAPLNSFSSDRSKERMRIDEIERYRARIRENIEYDRLLEEYPLDGETLDGYVELMAEACCTRRDFTRIAGNELPTGAVKSRFLKMSYEHIVYVLDCMKENTTFIRNIKAYTLAALYNAPTTIHAYYATRVNHDLYGVNAS